MAITTTPNQDTPYEIDGRAFTGDNGRYQVNNGYVKTAFHMGEQLGKEEAYAFGRAEKTITLDANWTNFGGDSSPSVTIYKNGARMNLSGSVCPNRAGAITYGHGGSQTADLAGWGNLSVGIPLCTYVGNYKHGESTPIQASIRIDAIAVDKVILSYIADFTSDNDSIMHSRGMATINVDIRTINKLGIHIGSGLVAYLPMFFRWQ